MTRAARPNPDERTRDLERKARLGDAEAQAQLDAMLKRSRWPNLRKPDSAHALAKERHAYRKWLRWISPELRQRAGAYECDHRERDKVAAGGWAQYPCRHKDQFPRLYLPTFSDYGGAPLIYLTRSGDVLCADCSNDPETPELDWSPPVSVGTHDEGPPEYCSHCNEPIESAYGDPDADEDEDGESRQNPDERARQAQTGRSAAPQDALRHGLWVRGLMTDLRYTSGGYQVVTIDGQRYLALLDARDYAGREWPIAVEYGEPREADGWALPAVKIRVLPQQNPDERMRRGQRDAAAGDSSAELQAGLAAYRAGQVIWPTRVRDPEHDERSRMATADFFFHGYDTPWIAIYLQPDQAHVWIDRAGPRSRTKAGRVRPREKDLPSHMERPLLGTSWSVSTNQNGWRGAPPEAAAAYPDLGKIPGPWPPPEGWWAVPRIQEAVREFAQEWGVDWRKYTDLGPPLPAHWRDYPPRPGEASHPRRQNPDERLRKLQRAAAAGDPEAAAALAAMRGRTFSPEEQLAQALTELGVEASVGELPSRTDPDVSIAAVAILLRGRRAARTLYFDPDAPFGGRWVEAVPCETGQHGHDTLAIATDQVPIERVAELAACTCDYALRDSWWRDSWCHLHGERA